MWQVGTNLGYNEYIVKSDVKVESWMRHLRQEHGLSLESLAELTGLSKVFLGKIERGERRPSIESAQAISEALGEPLEDVFPTDGRRGPHGAAQRYLEHVRAMRVSGSVPEAEFERDMQAHGLDPEEEASSPSPLVAVRKDDGGSETLVIDFSQMDESVHPLRIEVLPPAKPLRPRARQSRPQRSGKRAAGKSPPSSDPDEPEPELGPSTSKDFAGPTAAKKLERAGIAPSHQAVSGAARFLGMVR